MVSNCLCVYLMHWSVGCTLTVHGNHRHVRLALRPISLAPHPAFPWFNISDTEPFHSIGLNTFKAKTKI